MLELSRQKLKEDLYNVGAFAIETYGALQIQVTQEDTIRDIDSEYFYRTEKKNLQQIDKYYLVVGEENFIYSSDTAKPISVLMEEIRALDPKGRSWDSLERAGKPNVLTLLAMMRGGEALDDFIDRQDRKLSARSFVAPVEFNDGFTHYAKAWGNPKTNLFDWFRFVDGIDKFTDLVGLNWGAETFLEWHNSENA